MWVASRRAASGSAVGCSPSSSDTRRANGVRDASARDQQEPDRGDLALSLRGFVEVDAFNDEPYAHHWFEKRLQA